MAPNVLCLPGNVSAFRVTLALLLLVSLLLHPISAGHDYHDALRKSILFFEGQRSGKLPPDQRLKWRRDSALHDGSTAGVDLTGGYYDAGDNIKFGFPMAFTTTLLAWSVIDFGRTMGPELKNTVRAVKWGTDYLLKATAVPDVVFVQVGDPYSDHNCWERPEDMDTSRAVYKIDKNHPGSDVAGETAAALAAASIVFRSRDPAYSRLLLNRAVRVFEFADRHRGAYSASLRSAVCPFYCDVNGFQDELLWGAAWLHKASRRRVYREYIVRNEVVLRAGDTINEFGWDNKHAGINILISKIILIIIMYSSSNPNGYNKYASEQLHHQGGPPTGIPVSSSTEPYFSTSQDQDTDSHSHPYSHSQVPPHLRPRAPVPWSSGLCDCFSDPKNCCITCWCPCITFGQIAEIVDKGSTSCGASGALYTLISCVTGCPCFYSCFYRSKMRQQYALEESPCNDCLLHCFCEFCALCQEYRHLQSRGFDMAIGWHGNIEERNREVAMTPVPPVVEQGMSRDK